jgi:predicted transposase/invertase (TIGR01784 family)
MRELTETERESLAEYARLKRELDAKEELLEMKEAAREEGHAEGRAEGRAEGLAEAMKETARKLKAMGIPADQITEVSGLSAEAIASL